MVHFNSKLLAKFYLVIWAPFNYVYIQLSRTYPEPGIITVTFCKTWCYTSLGLKFFRFILLHNLVLKLKTQLIGTLIVILQNKSQQQKPEKPELLFSNFINTSDNVSPWICKSIFLNFQL